jgi:hypothetical protein
VCTVEDFLTSARDAVIIEDGAVVFDLAQSTYSISGEWNKCLLHLWSEERNFVRRVLEAEVKNEILRLAVQRPGQAKPTKLEICSERDRRTPTAKRAARVAYQQVLQRVLPRRFPGFTVDRLSSSMIWSDLLGLCTSEACYAEGNLLLPCWRKQETAGFHRCGADLRHSVARCLPRCESWKVRRRRAEAVFASGSLRFDSGAHGAFERGGGQVAAVCTGRTGRNLKELDIADCGNVATRLAHSTHESATLARLATAIEQVRKLMSSGKCDFIICGDRFSLSRSGVRTGTAGSRTRVVRQHIPDCFRYGRTEKDSQRH